MSGIETNKIFAALLLGGLIAMATGFIADRLVEPEPLAENVYAVALPEETAPAEAGGADEDAPAAEQPAGPTPVAPLLAAADPAAGQKVGRACAACHSFEEGGAAKIGPNLWDIVGADKAHAAGFSYSANLADAEGAWDYEALNAFLYDPKAYIPGTKMTFSGVKKDQDRANLIAWLRTLSADPAPLPQ